MKLFGEERGLGRNHGSSSIKDRVYSQPDYRVWNEVL